MIDALDVTSASLAHSGRAGLESSLGASTDLGRHTAGCPRYERLAHDQTGL